MHAYIHINRNSEISWPLSDSTYTPDSMCIAPFRSSSLSFFSSLSFCLCASSTHAVMGHDNTGRVHKKPEAIGENVAKLGKGILMKFDLFHWLYMMSCWCCVDSLTTWREGTKREWLERGCLDRIQMIHMLHINAGKTQKCLKKSHTP